MAEQNVEEEPSIEEILDSIRQIISDDDEEDSAPALPEPPPASEPEPEPEEIFDDIIELTDKVEEEEEEEFFPPEPEPESEPEPEVDFEEPAPIHKPEPENIFEPEENETEVAMAAQDTDSLLTQKAESAAFEGFMELAKKTAIEKNGITLEEIVRTELNPLLREWLDKNLPAIIERLVREELERISSRALDD